EKAWKIAAFAQLRDLQADRASARVPEPLAIAIAAVQALRASLSISRCTQAFGIHLHHPLGDELDHLPQQVGIGALFGELSKCDIGFGGGHRVVLSELRCRNPTLPRLTMAAASSRSAARSYTTNRDAIIVAVKKLAPWLAAACSTASLVSWKARCAAVFSLFALSCSASTLSR